MEPINGSASVPRMQGVTTRPIQGTPIISRPMIPLLGADDKSRQDTLQLSARYKAYAAVDEDAPKPIFNPPMELKLPVEGEISQKSSLTGIQKRGMKIYAGLIRLALHLDIL